MSVKRTCSLETCDRLYHTSGFCGAHYYRWIRNGDPNEAKPVRVHTKVSRYCKNGHDLEVVGKVSSRGLCKACRSEGNRRYRERHGPETLLVRLSRSRYKGVTGVPEELIRFGSCPICGEERKLVMDHDHNTLRFRGFICSPCNLSLSVIENPDWVAKARRYLQSVA